jgi:recombination protein RecT
MNDVATQQQQPLVVLNNNLIARAEQFKAVLPAHITVEKFQRTIMTAVQSDPALLEADRRSLMLACMKAAQDNLLPDKRESALVLFNNRKKDAFGKWHTTKEVVYMPMTYGLRKKILQSGEVRDITTAVVYVQEEQAGRFVYEEGTERLLRHKPILDGDFDPSDDDVIAAYSVATFADGSKSFEVMRRSEINKVRQTSKTGATGRTTFKGDPIAASGPWVDWFSEMCRKTVMRRHAKSLPMSGDLLDIEAKDDAAYARSVVTALDMREPDAPQEIEGHGTPSLPATDDLMAEADMFDAETGEVYDESQQSADQADTMDAKGRDQASKSPPWELLCDDIFSQLNGASTSDAVDTIDKDWKARSGDRGLWPDAGLATADDVDTEINSARKRLS